MIQFSLTLSGPQLALLRDVRDGKEIAGSPTHGRYFITASRVLEREGLMIWCRYENGRITEPFRITRKGALALQIAEIDVAEFAASMEPARRKQRTA